MVDLQVPTVEQLAEWLMDHKYDFISADSCECCGATIDLDAEGMAEALLKFIKGND